MGSGRCHPTRFRTRPGRSVARTQQRGRYRVVGPALATESRGWTSKLRPQTASGYEDAPGWHGARILQAEGDSKPSSHVGVPIGLQMRSMESIRAEGPENGPTRDLAARLQQAAAAIHSIQPAVAALGYLDPSAGLAWLIDQGPEVRTACRTSELARLVDMVAEQGLRRGGRELGPQLVELARRYGDVISGDTLAAIVSALAPEDRATAQDVTAQLLEREPMNVSLLRAACELALGARGTDGHSLLTRLARADDSLATVRSVWRARSKLPSVGNPRVRVALLSSFTIDPLVPYVDLECRALGLDPEIYVAPFNSWAQEIIGDGSGLRRFNADITFVAVSVDDLIPALAGAPPPAELQGLGDAAVEQLLQVVHAFSTWSQAVLVVHSFHSAYADPLGIPRNREAPSRAEWLAKLNAQLSAGLRQEPRAHLLDITDVFARRSGGVADNPKLRHLAAMRLGEGVLGDVSRGYARYIAPVKGLTRKCVVVDLDNTLWGGVVGEDGKDGIKLGPTSPGSEYQDFQRYLLSLTGRGILLAINSKNNLTDALEIIRSHEGMVLREDSFSAMRINWQPKSENLRSLADELNIGLDAMVFLDDSAEERELIRQMFPEVLTPDLPADPALYRQTVEALPQLQVLGLTSEDRSRAAQYSATRERKRARGCATSLEDYLGSLRIVVETTRATVETLPRVHQLMQRTNQFNLTTRRYDAGQVAAFARDPARRIYVLRSRDRFGDHGVVATAVVRVDEDCWTMDSFLMSCRVIGYGVETALLAAVSREAERAGADVLVGEFIETDKNAPARDFYPRHGFRRDTVLNGVIRWRRRLSDGCPEDPTWVTVVENDT